MKDAPHDKPRSTSRDRKTFVRFTDLSISDDKTYLLLQRSSGRGGSGNIRRNSQDSSPESAAERMHASIRGREVHPSASSSESVGIPILSLVLRRPYVTMHSADRLELRGVEVLGTSFQRLKPAF